MYCVGSCSLSLEISAAHVMNCVDPRRIDEFAVFVVDKYGDDLLVAVGTVIADRHRVAGGSHPPPAPTEPSVRISRTGLVRSGFTVWRGPVAPGK
jgi:hypothetical protein